MSNRDMTAFEFARALECNGFKRALGLWFWFEDTTGQTPGISYGAVLNGPGSIDRRQTLSRIIREREQRAAKAQ